MKSPSLLFVSLFLGLLSAFPSSSLIAAVTERSATQASPPTLKAEWDKLINEAKKEGRVVIYAGPIGEARTAMVTAFRQKYGITLDIIMSRGSEIVAKVETERRAGLYMVDVGFIGLESYFGSPQLKGFTLPLSSLLVLPEILDLAHWRGEKMPFADKEGHLAALVLGSSPYMLINTEIVKPGEITSHQDLLEPKWRGKLAINDPSVGGAGSEWFTFIVAKVMGLEKGTAYMKQLARQEPAVTRDQRLLTEWVARGKYAAALAPDKATTVQMIRTGAPLAYIDLKEPRPTTSGPGNIMVFDKLPHPNATKLFINWLLSREGAAVYSKGHGYVSTRLDVATEGIDPFVIPAPNDAILGEDYQTARGKMRKLAAEIFRN